MSTGSTNSTSRFIVVGVVLTLALLLAAGIAAYLRQYAAAGPAMPVYGKVAPFALTNQDARTITLADLQGRPWVADIIFTRCAGPCPGMTRQMRAIQDALPKDSRTLLISLTTDPDFDTPAVLKTYANRFGSDHQRWWFLTGSKKEIGNLAVDSLKLTREEKPPEARQDPADLFIHSTLLVLVDARGRLRAIYPTTDLEGNPEPVTDRVIQDIKRLEREQ